VASVSDVISADLVKERAQLFRGLERTHLVLHLVVVQDLVQISLVLLPVVNRNRDSLGAESARATDSVQVVLRVSDSLVASACALGRHIEVDHDLNLRDIDTSGKHIGSDDDADFAGAELGDHLVTLLNAHVSENDSRLEVVLDHHVVESVSVGLGVNEDDGLGHLARVEDLLNEFGLLTLLAAELELPNMAQLQLLFAKVNLLGFWRELRNCSLHILCIRRREENVLNLLRQGLKGALVDFLHGSQVLLIAEENIRLVHDKTFESRQVENTLAATLLENIGKFAKGGHNDVRVYVGVDGQVGHGDVGVLGQLGVDVGNLRRELTNVGHAQNLRLLDGSVDSQRRSNREGSSLARAILALSNQVVEHSVDRSRDQGDSHALNV